jgi:hypothetical protein
MNYTQDLGNEWELPLRCLSKRKNPCHGSTLSSVNLLINEEVRPCPVYSFLGTLTTHTRNELCQVDLVRVSGKQLHHQLLYDVLKVMPR